MGILRNEYYQEASCDRREGCRYYVEGFYARNIDHIGDYDELKNEPGKACKHYLPRE